MTEAPPQLPGGQIVRPQRTSKAAIWSLILGISSNLCLWILGSIPAIILGIIAFKNINREPSKIGGKGLAIAGIITACIGLFVGAMVVSIFSIGGTAYQRGAGRAKCILQQTVVQKAVLAHAELKDLKPGDELPITLLVDGEGYLTVVPTCPDGGSYKFLGRVPDSTVTYVKCDQEGHVLDLNR